MELCASVHCTYAYMNKDSEENEGKRPLLTKHHNFEKKIYTYFMLLFYNKRWHAAQVLTCSRID